MQRRNEGIKRERISVSLDAVDYEYVRSITGSSDSHKLAKLVRAARLVELDADQVAGGSIVDELVDWLGKKQSKPARELHALLSEFLDER